MKKLFLVLCTFVAMSSAVSAQSKTLPVVAISDFDRTGGISDEDMDLFSDAFMDELAVQGRGKLKVVDRKAFKKRAAELDFQRSDWSNPDKVAAMGKALGASQMIVGQLRLMDGGFRVTIRLEDVNSTEIIIALPSSMSKAKDIDEILDKKVSEWCKYLVSHIDGGPVASINTSSASTSSSSASSTSTQQSQKSTTQPAKKEVAYKDVWVDDGWGIGKVLCVSLGAGLVVPGAVCLLVAPEDLWLVGTCCLGGAAILVITGFILGNDGHYERVPVSKFDNTNLFQNMQVSIVSGTVTVGYTLHL